MKDIQIEQLGPNKVEEALLFFSQSIPSCWPNTAEEARGWVYNEFLHPKAIILGAINEGTIIGTLCLIPFLSIIERMEASEKEKVTTGIEGLSPTVDIKKIIHYGGFSAKSNIGKELIGLADKMARTHNFDFVIGHTARPNKKYPQVRVWNFLQHALGVQELLPGCLMRYSSPPDLQKIWMYRYL